MVIPDQLRREGWPGQLRRVERWQDRALTALTASSNGLDDVDVIDYLFTFFQSAYHLRDWVEKTGAATKAQLDQLMADTPALRRCRDLCNGSKHLALNETHHYRRIHMMQEYRGQASYRIRMIAFERWDGATDYEYVEELVNAVVVAWQAFCQTLPPPKPALTFPGS